MLLAKIKGFFGLIIVVLVAFSPFFIVIFAFYLAVRFVQGFFDLPAYIAVPAVVAAMLFIVKVIRYFTGIGNVDHDSRMRQLYEE